jgi:hypothetical protein
MVWIYRIQDIEIRTFNRKQYSEVLKYKMVFLTFLVAKIT